MVPKGKPKGLWQYLQMWTKIWIFGCCEGFPFVGFEHHLDPYSCPLKASFPKARGDVLRDKREP